VPEYSVDVYVMFVLDGLVNVSPTLTVAPGASDAPGNVM
jgi:hypothetical protein